jgi:1-acyl-sn-glycerol-3-phosphate acyltransferase
VVWIWIALALVGWALLAWAADAVRRASVRPEDPTSGLVLIATRLYCRLVHRLRVHGLQRARAARDAGGPLMVVSNHTAGLDPALIQAALDFEVRWMMAADMRAPQLEEWWQYGRVIFVDRSGKDTSSVREALRHLKAGGALGVFPEGRLERPAEHLMPFREGVGLLAIKSGATVLPVVVDGTPVGRTAWSSFLKSSRSRVRFLEPTTYPRKDWKPDAVAADLQDRFQRATGWPVSDRRPIIGAGRRILLDPDARYVDETGAVLTDEQADAIRAEVAPAPRQEDGA